MSESRIQDEIQLEASKHGTKVLRNQVGRYQLEDGRWISYGLCVGSSDLIGWTPVTIKPEMVGRKLAVFTAIEVKTPSGKPTKAQSQFLTTVTKDGGLSMIARSKEEAIVKINDFLG